MPSVAVASQNARGYAGAAAALTSLLGANFDGAHVDLYTNDIVPGPSQVVGDFDIATWTGYTQGVVTSFGTVHRAPDGYSAEADSTNVMAFTGPAAGGGPICYGYIVRDNADAGLLGAFRFDEPVPLTDNSNTLSVVLTVTVPASQV